METQSTDRPSGTSGEIDRDHEAHLERSRRVWDRWSDWYAMSERDFEPIREAAIDRLDLDPGDRVLDVGCGPGVNLARLRNDVGESGRVVAVDYSPEMVAKASARVEQNGWENVAVHRADATTVDFDEPFDAAIATLSMSVMPDVRATTANVHRLLEPDAPFVVVDLGPTPNWPVRLLNPLIWRFFRWYANWSPNGDVLESLETVFADCDLLERHLAGVVYTARCRTAASTGADAATDRD